MSLTTARKIPARAGRDVEVSWYPIGDIASGLDDTLAGQEVVGQRDLLDTVVPLGEVMMFET